MKVAYLTSQYPATSHTFIRREVEALRRAGIDVSTFSIRKPAQDERGDPENLDAIQTTTYILPSRLRVLLAAHLVGLVQNPLQYLRTLREAFRHRVPGLRACIYSLIYFSEALILVKMLRAQNIRHLHNHFANASAIVGMLTALYMRIDFSLTLHGISEFDYPAGLLLPAKLQRARFVACVSHFGRAQAMRVTNPDQWAKMMIVRCGIDPTRFSAQTEALPNARLRLLHVGRLSPEKGQAGLISAFAQVRQHGIDAELRIVGCGPLEADLKKQVRDLGLAPHCVFLGRQGEKGVIEELRRADAFVISSLMEGLPVALMEALAFKVPVVAPNVAGVPELVIHNETGLLFAPGNWNDLADQLRLMLADAPKRRRLALAGHEKTLRNFDIETAVMPLVNCFSGKSPEFARYPAPPKRRSQAPAISLPLDGRWRFGADVVGDPIDATHLVDDAAADLLEQCIGQLGPVGGHEIAGLNRAQSHYVVVGATIAHHAHALDR
jgi:glycosyltransferase involved in cell wall biosynthesis